MNHHAYVYIGTDLSVVPEELSKQGADIEHVITDRLAIADARHLKESAYRKPQVARQRHVVIVARDMPTETQNTLLKLLEEPPETSVFHLVVPRRDILLPTVLSRVQVVDNFSTQINVSSSDEFKTFLETSYKDRLAQIETAHKKKDSVWFLELFNEVELFVRTVLKKDVKLAERLLLNCIRSRNSGSSQKMLAEDIALILPSNKNMV